MVRKIPLFAPETPGEVLKRHILGERRVTQDDLAAAMNVSRLTVNQIINGKRSVTAETALKLAHVLGTTAEFWLNLQRDVDLFEAKKKIQADLYNLTVLNKKRASA
jgi:addiction module HigA family antidote